MTQQQWFDYKSVERDLSLRGCKVRMRGIDLCYETWRQLLIWFV